MACFINPIEEDQCVCLSCEGEIPPRELAAVSYEAHALANARRWTRMMFDITQLRSSPTAAQLLDFAKILAGQVSRDARVAVVVRPDQARQANFLEKIARKSGVFLAYFLDPEKAAAWVKRTNARPGALRTHNLALPIKKPGPLKQPPPSPAATYETNTRLIRSGRFPSPYCPSPSRGLTQRV